MTNPQSWNRYAYVGNNPLSFVDPLGLKYCVTGGDTTVAGDTGIPCGGAAGGGGGGGDGDPNCTVVSGSGFNFGFGFNGGLGGPCGESLGIPCGLPSLPSPGLLDILGLSPGDNCLPICDVTSGPGRTQGFIEELESFNQTALGYNGSHATAVGKATEFFSALSWFPVDNNWQNNIKDTATFGLTKAGTVCNHLTGTVGYFHVFIAPSVLCKSLK